MSLDNIMKTGLILLTLLGTVAVAEVQAAEASALDKILDAGREYGEHREREARRERREERDDHAREHRKKHRHESKRDREHAPGREKPHHARRRS